MLNRLLEIDKNIVYRVYYYAIFRVEDDFFNDKKEDYPPYIAHVDGEIHIYPESIVVIPVEHVVDTEDQPVTLYVVPAVCVHDVQPLHLRRERKTK